jgi:hypothetical protein
VTELTFEWTKAIDRRGNLTLEWGAAWIWSSPQPGESTSQPMPVLGAAFELRSALNQEGRPKAMTFELRLAPYFDRLSGDVYPQFQGRASYGYLATGALSLEAVGGVAAPADDLLGTRSLALAELRADIRFTPTTRLGAGVRALVGTTGGEAAVFVDFQTGVRTGPGPGGAR